MRRTLESLQLGLPFCSCLPLLSSKERGRERGEAVTSPHPGSLVCPTLPGPEVPGAPLEQGSRGWEEMEHICSREETSLLKLCGAWEG